MAAVHSGSDAIRFYLTAARAATSYQHNTSLGGYPVPVEVGGKGFMISAVIPGLYIDYVSGACSNGVGHLRADSGTLTWQAPGSSTPGAAVTLALGETALLLDGTDMNAWIRVTNAYADSGCTGDMGLTLSDPWNTVIAMGDSTTAGGTVYRAIMMQNVGEETLSGLYLFSDSLEIGMEVPGLDGNIQEVANETTAPTGVSFASGFIDLPVILPGMMLGIRLKRVIANPSAVNLSALANFYLTDEFPVFVEKALAGKYRILGAASYQLFKGEDALPDFLSSPSGSGAALPLTVVVSPPATGTKIVYLTTRKTNRAGLQGYNQFAHPFVIDAAGALVTHELVDPVVTLTALESGRYWLHAEYQGGLDDPWADTWLVWITTDGTDPDLDATPTQTIMMLPDGMTDTFKLDIHDGPLAYMSRIKAIVRVKRTSDGALSDNTAITTLDITKPQLLQPSGRGQIIGVTQTDAAGNWLDEAVTITESALHNTYWQIARGMVRLYVGGVCAFVLTPTQFRTRLAFTNTTISGASAKDGLESVTSTLAYFAVAGERVLKIDITAGTIEFASWSFEPASASVFRYPYECDAAGMGLNIRVDTLWLRVWHISAAGDIVSAAQQTFCENDDQLFG